MKKLLFATAGLLFAFVACQVQDEQIVDNKKETLQRVGT